MAPPTADLTAHARQVAAAEKRIEMLPGTELMAEVAGVHLVHAANSPNATVLVPQPSASPHDPLV